MRQDPRDTLGQRDRVVGEVTGEDQRRPGRPEVLMMEGADCFRSHLADRLRLAAVHPSGSPALLEYRSPEGDARNLRRVGLSLFDLGQPELHMAVHVALGERRLGHSLGEQLESTMQMRCRNVEHGLQP